MVKKAGTIQPDRVQHTEAGTAQSVVCFGPMRHQLCLDFANSLDHRLTGHPIEPLTSYADLVSWSQQHGLLTEPQEAQLRQAAARHPDAAAAVLARAIALREAIYRMFSAVAAGRLPEPADLATLNAVLSKALGALHILGAASGFAWAWKAEDIALDRMLWPVALSAAQLLTSDARSIVRECAATDCGWLFLDTTRNGSRRWCDMRVCGNRAKARRHYERRKRAAWSGAADRPPPSSGPGKDSPPGRTRRRPSAS